MWSLRPVRSYLRCKHPFQANDQSHRVSGLGLTLRVCDLHLLFLQVIRDFMFGAQLDNSGEGMHYQLITRVHGWDAATAQQWTDALARNFMSDFLGVASHAAS